MKMHTDDIGGRSPRRPVSVASLENLGPPAPVKWLWADAIPSGEVTLLAGDGGIGKGVLTSQLAVAVANGQTLFGGAVMRGPVVMVNAEDNDERMHRSIVNASAAFGDRMKLDEIFILSLRDEADPRLIVAGEVSPVLSVIEQFVQDIRPALLILDPAADLYGGNPLDAVAVNAFMRRLSSLAERYGVAVILVSHVSLSGAAEGSGRSGLTVWSNKARARLYLRRADGVAEKNSTSRVLEVTKANLGPVGRQWALRYEDGQLIEREDVRAVIEKPRFSKNERAALRALQSVIGGGCHAPVETWRKTMSDHDAGKSNEARRKEFYRVRKSFLEQGLIVISDEIVTVTNRDIFQFCPNVPG